MDRFTQAYLECALWSSVDEEDRSLEENYSVQDFTPRALQSAVDDCDDFQASQAKDLAGLDQDQCGQDFWLTRNGHGAGFWDRGLGARGDRLTAAAKIYGSVDLIVANDWVDSN